jgi:hypothetical protein
MFPLGRRLFPIGGLFLFCAAGIGRAFVCILPQCVILSNRFFMKKLIYSAFFAFCAAVIRVKRGGIFRLDSATFLFYFGKYGKKMSFARSFFTLNNSTLHSSIGPAKRDFEDLKCIKCLTFKEK